MPEQLTRFLDRLQNLSAGDLKDGDWRVFLIAIGFSLAASIAASLMYSLFFERRSTGSDIHRAFPLLGTAITGVFICLQFSLPLSLGLLGALSIVRFRTPIKEPEEIGFLMLLIATSICCATMNFLYLGILLLVSTAALLGMRCLPWLFGRRTSIGSIVISTNPEDFDRICDEVLQRVRASSKGARLDAVTNYEGTSSATVTLYHGDGASLTKLQRELRELVGDGEVNLFFQKPLAL